VIGRAIGRPQQPLELLRAGTGQRQASGRGSRVNGVE
jgi:hypothetical protein